MAIIETQNISKEYESRLSKQTVKALNDFTFSVNEGEIFGLLGPNGAGKTTLIKILLGITFPTRGTATVFGSNITDHRWKNKAGYLPENHRFPNYLTGEQVMSYYGQLSGLKADADFHKRSDELIERMGLTNFKKTKIKKYSKGMMQKLGLAQALLSKPELLFLDEPTDGVDPIGRKEIRDILINLRAEGKTIFLNSHLLSEVELVCDRVAILNKGDLIKAGKVGDLTRTENVFEIHTANEIPEEIRRQILTIDNNAGLGSNEIHTEVNTEKLNELIDLLRSKKINIMTVVQKHSSLEEYFINVIQKDNIEA
jgi:ABC-2 type transport system ATP-binding protein